MEKVSERLLPNLSYVDPGNADMSLESINADLENEIAREQDVRQESERVVENVSDGTLSGKNVNMNPNELILQILSGLKTSFEQNNVNMDSKMSGLKTSFDMDRSERKADFKNLEINLRDEISKIGMGLQQDIDRVETKFDEQVAGTVDNINQLKTRVQDLELEVVNAKPELTKFATELIVDEVETKCQSLKDHVLELVDNSHKSVLRSVIQTDKQVNELDKALLKLSVNTQDNFKNVQSEVNVRFQTLTSKMTVVEQKVRNLQKPVVDHKIQSEDSPFCLSDPVYRKGGEGFGDYHFGKDWEKLTSHKDEINFEKSKDIFDHRPVSVLASKAHDVCSAQLKLPWFGDKNILSAHQFIVKMEKYFSRLPFSEDDKLSLVETALKGQALVWFNQVSESLITWEQFKVAFLDKYFSKKIRSDMLKVAIGRKQQSREPCYVFISEVISQIKETGEQQEDEFWIEKILPNMISEFVNAAIAQQIRSLPKLLSAAEYFDSYSPLILNVGNVSTKQMGKSSRPNHASFPSSNSYAHMQPTNVTTPVIPYPPPPLGYPYYTMPQQPNQNPIASVNMLSGLSSVQSSVPRRNVRNNVKFKPRSGTQSYFRERSNEQTNRSPQGYVSQGVYQPNAQDVVSENQTGAT